METAQSMRQVRSVIESAGDPVVVVVSALAGVTDLLTAAAIDASSGRDFKNIQQTIEKKHYDVTGSLFDDPSRVNAKLGGLLADLSDLLHGVALLKELSPRSMDAIVAHGELLSSAIIHLFIADSLWFDSRSLIVTNREGSRNIVDSELTGRLLSEAGSKLGSINIFPGFIASDRSGVTTTLGRGGSDYTAALLAAAFGASELEIYTDVDGFMTADPKVISRAYTINHLTYSEAMELSHFGAKVIYPPTIMPVCQKGIPIRIKNTFRPHQPGTLIDAVPNGSPESHIKGISSIQDVSLLTIQGPGMVGVTGISQRLFGALAHNFINVVLISQASSENSISFVVRATEAAAARQAVETEFASELMAGHILPVCQENNMAVVAIVGERMKQTTGVAGKMFHALGTNGVNVYAIAQGASELNISIVIKNEFLKKSLNSLHDAFFLSRHKVLHLFLAGVGTVGSKLVEKLCRQAARLKASDRLVIRIAGVSNSRSMVFDPQGMNPDLVGELLAKGEPATPEQFCERIKQLNLANSVFVDCTASEKVASVYHELLKSNVNVVTANKIAGSSSYGVYKLLKDTAREKGVKFLFETNVGAALPIISPINDLLKSGDRIIRLEAVLSGTLNFIVNGISPTARLSEVIAAARAHGYSEPDPRIDLSGLDVARKILILARESGNAIDFEDIEKEPFIPDSFFVDESVDSFMERVKQLDDEFEQRRASLEAEGKKMRFVAVLENGKASVGMKFIDQNHPFFHLEGSNNVVLIWSDNYNEHPMQIKGYGAGADVTAAGVFADIIKVANL